MPLYEIVKADGSREKVSAMQWSAINGALVVMKAGEHHDDLVQWQHYAPGAWLEVWRREGVGE